MPVLGNALDFAKYEGRNLRAHQLGANPSAPVTGQLYYNTADNTLYWWDGSQWVSARGGATATPPATAASLGTIQLAGDLAGTAASPQIAAGVITDVDVNVANKDGAVGTASMRTLGAGAQQAMPGNRTLDAITPPAAAVNMNNKKLSAVADPTLTTDGANKQYVDNTVSNAIQGLDTKASVRVATTANHTLTGTAAIDGFVLNDGDRVLVKNQTDPTQNGIYDAAPVAWVRSGDANVFNELISAYVWVEQGATQADTGWVSTVDAGGSLGATSINWTQFSGAAQIIAGAGMTKAGNQLDVGAGPGITVNADTIQVANNGITNAMMADGAVDLASADVINTLPLGKGGTGQTTAKTARESGIGATGIFSSAAHGAGAVLTVPAATHGLRASKGLYIQVQDEATGAVEIPDIVVAANGDVTVTYGASVAANSKRVTVIG